MIYVPDYLKPHICVNYPQSNLLIFEEWLSQQTLPQLEREFIPVHITSYHVNNNYGQNTEAVRRLQEFFDGLDRSKKYWCAFQYDDGLLIDTKDLDIVTFGMSYRLSEQKPTYELPLIGQMGDRLIRDKKYKASFIGTRTHPIRDEIVYVLSNKSEYFVSTEPFRPQEYFEIMAQSEFTICPRGYGVPSFRTFEAIHNYSIPVYVSDVFLEPYGIDFNEYGVKVDADCVSILPEILGSISPYSIDKKVAKMDELYKDLCTYEGVLNRTIDTLKNESKHNPLR